MIFKVEHISCNLISFLHYEVIFGTDLPCPLTYYDEVHLTRKNNSHFANSLYKMIKRGKLKTLNVLPGQNLSFSTWAACQVMPSAPLNINSSSDVNHSDPSPMETNSSTPLNNSSTVPSRDSVNIKDQDFEDLLSDLQVEYGQVKGKDS